MFLATIQLVPTARPEPQDRWAAQLLGKFHLRSWATAFGGGTIEDTTGAPISLSVGGREFLASAQGFDPDIGPDGCEPQDGSPWLRVSAVDASLIVE